MNLHSNACRSRTIVLLALTVGVISFTLGCSGLTWLNAIAPSSAERVKSGISYGPMPRQRLDVYSRPDFDKPQPVVVFFYGGAWQSGDRSQYRFVADALAPHGFVVVIPDYRVYPPHGFPAFMEDGANAVRWVRDNIARFGGDPRRINLMGHSAGAYIAAMLTLNEQYLEAVGLQPALIRSSVGLAGPYDFLPITDADIKAVFGPPEIIERTQPINFVDGNEPPMLLAAGSDDRRVNPGNTRRLAARIRAQGGAVREIIYPGVGHAGILAALALPFQWPAPTSQDAAAFLLRYNTEAQGSESLAD